MSNLPYIIKHVKHKSCTLVMLLLHSEPFIILYSNLNIFIFFFPITRSILINWLNEHVQASVLKQMVKVLLE